jgi:beta-glucosidase-like glycosyl hydrolase
MRIVHSLTMVAFVLVASVVWSQDSANVIYKNPKAAIPERVRDLLNRMTIEEKVAQLQSQWSLPSIGMDSPSLVAPSLFEKGHLNEKAVQKTLGNGMGTYAFLDEFMGMNPGGPREGAERRNLMQNWILKNTRLGIPILFHGESLHGAATKGATLFPQAVGLGSTWDPDLLKEMFTTVAQEVRASGNALVLAPVLDLSRDPRYGRVEEMYSEDPFLVGQLGVAAVLGLQGDKFQLDPEHVFATAKHFVHGQPENGTNVGPNDFSERTMRQVFLYPFQQVVEKAHIAAVMPSYNENNGGVPSHANPWLLKEVLRKEWGFTGITVSDYMAVEQLNSLQHVAADNAAAGALALNSGVDMELPAPSGYTGLAAAVKAGKVTAKDLDAAVARVLTIKFRAGLFDHPLTDPDKAAEVVGNRKHGELARKVADEAIILLQNKGNVLPLDAAKIKTLAVIGPNANKKRQGTYSGIPPYFVTVLDGIRQRVGSSAKVVYAEGCRISEPDAAPNFNIFMPYQAPKEEADRKLIKEAVDVASSADVVVLVLGGNEVVSRESIGQMIPGSPPAYGDSDTLELPGRQNELVREVAKLGKPMVAVLLNGKAYSIEQLAAQVPGILEGWYLGQETGNAVADVLFGDVNPSGHLPVTIAHNVGQLPVYYYKTPAARRGYLFTDNTPLFPFGFGLSYTTFDFGKPTLDRASISAKETASVSIAVTNSGTKAGDQVVQMYVHHTVSSVVQPVIALRGFKRIHLEPGASTTVSFDVGPDQLSILDAQMKKTVELGTVDLQLGSSSADTSSVRLTITN